MEKEKMNIGAPGNQGSIETEQELNERVDQALAKIIQRSRWSVVLALACITFCLWFSLTERPIDHQLGYKTIIVAVFALMHMCISVIDLLWAGKFKNATRQEQFEGVLRHRERERLARMLSPFFFFLYILMDVIFGGIGISRILLVVLFVVFVFVYWVAYDKTSVYQREADLEGDIRELTKREQ